MPSVFPQWVQDLNTGLSFFGFVITLYVLFEVKRIRSTFLARARLPDLIKGLSKAGSALNINLINQWPSQRNEARGQIKIAATLLKSTLSMLPSLERKELVRVQAKLADAARNFSEPKYSEFEIVFDLYSDIQTCLTSLTQVSKNMKWE